MASKKNTLTAPIIEDTADTSASAALLPVSDIRYERIAQIVRTCQDFQLAYICCLAVVSGGRINLGELLRAGWNHTAIGSLSAALAYYVSIGKVRKLDSDTYIING